MTDMQLRTVAFVGRIRHRKVAGVAVRHGDAEILTGLELGSNASGKAQLQDEDGIGWPADAVEPCCHSLARLGIVSLNPLRMNENPPLRPGLAEQNPLP